MGSRVNLATLTPSRRNPKLGDVFAMLPPDGMYLFGRVVATDAVALGPGAILIYIYSYRSESKRPPPTLLPSDLLTAPMMTNRQPWIKGYFECVEHRPLLPEDVLEQHCFRDSRGRMFDEYYRPLHAITEPVGIQGLHSYRTIDDEISVALGIPQAPDEPHSK